MYIKRIVIEGFKTYKDRVIIDLDPGMTIIGTRLSPRSFFRAHESGRLSLARDPSPDSDRHQAPSAVPYMPC